MKFQGSVSLLIVALVSSACLNPAGDGSKLSRQTNTGGNNQGTGPTPTPTPTLPPPTPIPGSNLAAAIGAVDPNASQASGYAFDQAALGTPVYVEFWLNGPVGTGTFGGMVLSNQLRTQPPDGNTGFTFTVPAAMQNGKQNRVYAYVINPQNQARVQMAGSPRDFFAGTNQAGLNYFTNTVRPAYINSCTRCHGNPVYLTLKFSLSEPSTFAGGTQTNNTLVLKGAGNAHGGGNVCGSPNGAPCTLFRTWWTTEFN